ncbi:hypothetical protein CONCODRAFT_80213 [Conidiobolus coronatus NRRL 28638]|uniref:Uncharacterized protein n=1 Tax=Conidiobolus coronatus (strain ATCC 28846 / CBS 209.66 / NRRL 28638) TaxID=796925 RepID=A0A137NWX3_CONC2|nr:hypothetical protein CONCODRAFT_80213 [Conidiobolus coronatus NRRL 28638]|eukprot:KXN67323.1 hypothetical protein CONCODRAFT_80213 [Conidiobolus coronatus NRRL 28638]
MLVFKNLFIYTLTTGFVVGEYVYRCGNEKGDTCPAGYTCCGPITFPDGGTCRKLKANEVCIF